MKRSQPEWQHCQGIANEPQATTICVGTGVIKWESQAPVRKQAGNFTLFVHLKDSQQGVCHRLGRRMIWAKVTVLGKARPCPFSTHLEPVSWQKPHNVPPPQFPHPYPCCNIASLWNTYSFFLTRTLPFFWDWHPFFGELFPPLQSSTWL